MDYPNFLDALVKFKDEVVRLSKLELGTFRKKPRRRSTWKKTGKGWKPTSTKVKYKPGNYVASGKLQSSISGKASVDKDGNAQILFQEESYGAFVRAGRKPKGKFPPPNRIQEWAKVKRLPLRDLKTNEFTKSTPSKLKGRAFVIARSIAHFGIEPFDYAGKAYVAGFKKHEQKLRDALIRDIEENGFND